MKRVILAIVAVAALAVYFVTPAATLPGPEPGSPDFSLFVQGLSPEGFPVDQIDPAINFDTATGWDFGDRLHYRCAVVEHFTAGVLDFKVEFERVGQVTGQASNYVKVSDQNGKETEGNGGGMSCGQPGGAKLVVDGTDHFPHHTMLHFTRNGSTFEVLDLMRDDCAKGYWTPGDQAGEAWLWWDADGPTHTEPGGVMLDCGGGENEPVAVVRAFVTYRAPGIGVCTMDMLDGDMCIGTDVTPTPTPTPTTPAPTPTPTCNPSRPRCH